MALTPVEPDHLSACPFVNAGAGADASPSRPRRERRGRETTARSALEAVDLEKRYRLGRHVEVDAVRGVSLGAAARHDHRAGGRERLRQDDGGALAGRPGDAAPAGRSCSTARRSTPPPGAAFAPTRERCRWSSRTRSPRSTRCTRCAITSSARCACTRSAPGLEAGQDELDRLLGQVRLSPPDQFRDAYPHELSGGQRQRVAIARALAASPRVLLADEPVSMLDVSIRLEMLDLIEELRARLDLAVLYITHDIASARYFADEILVMHAGRDRRARPGRAGDPGSQPRIHAAVDRLRAGPGRVRAPASGSKGGPRHESIDAGA